VEAYTAQYELKGSTADPLLRAQQSLILAEVSYYQSVAQYNQAITDFYYRTGTILEESNISLAEDMWDPHAYSDALREAWARSHGTPNPLLHTEPPEFVVPPGRPTGSVPMVPASCPPAFAPQAQTTPAVPPNSSQPPAAPTQPNSRPRNEAEPAAPLPTPPSGPTVMRQADIANLPSLQSVVSVSAGAANLASPVTTAAGSYETFLQPVPGGAARPPVFATQAVPEFLAPPIVTPPVLQPPAASWSVPQPSANAPPASPNTIDEVHSADQFDMPLNQLGQ
jgi:hypothetical protein